MRTRRSLVVVVAIPFALIAFGQIVSSRSAPRLGAAPVDAFALPASLAANADGDVYVSFGSDYWVRIVRRRRSLIKSDDFAPHARGDSFF